MHPPTIAVPRGRQGFELSPTVALLAFWFTFGFHKGAFEETRNI